MVPRRFFPLYAFAAVFIGLSMITRLALLLRPDTDLLESFCIENETDLAHMKKH